MRVMHLIYSLDRGGAEVDLVGKAKILKEYGYRLIVICLVREGALAKQLSNCGIDVVSLGMRGKWDVTALVKFYKVLKMFKPHILHTHLFASNFIGRVVGYLCGVDVLVCSVQNSADLMKHWEVFVDSKLIYITKKIIASSYAVKESLIRRIGIAEDKIEVIYNGVNCERYLRSRNFDRYLWRKQLNLDEDTYLLCTVARLHPIKGLNYLLDAAAILKNSLRNFKLLIVGEGKQRQQLQKQTSKLKLNDYVMFLGERGDVDNILKGIDIFILPSLSEALSVALLEALLFAKPAIATNTGGIVEVIKDNVTGFLVEPRNSHALAEKILYCITHLEESKQVGKNGSEFVNQMFDIRKLAQKLHNIYQKLYHKV